MASLPGGVTVFAMTAVMALDTSDQSAIGATSPEVREALGIGQTGIGVLATSSTLVGALFSLPFGVLADRTNRLRVLRGTVIVWVIAMLGVGSAPNFTLMLIAHSVLGLVTGAAGPLIASMVGDLVPLPQRGRVFSVLLLGELFGSVLGLSVSGEISALFGWRWAYWSLGVIGALVLGVLTRAREPERASDRITKRRSERRSERRAERRAERGADPSGERRTMREAVVLVLRNHTLVLLVLASALGYYFFAGVQTFAVSLLREDYGASAALAPILVLFVGLSLAVGVVIGGPAGDRLLKRRPGRGRLPLLVVAFAGSLAFIVPGLISTQLTLTIVLLMAGGILLGVANPPLDATRIDIVWPGLRGRAEALRTAVKDGADASSPVLFGVTAAAIGLRPTFVVMTSTLGMALVLCAVAIATYPKDARDHNVQDDSGELHPEVVDGV